MQKLLVIEDNVALLEEILTALEFENFEVYGAVDGEQGVAMALQHLPDLIVSDIMLPVMDGFGILETLRQSPSTSTIPFIFLTARVERKDIRRGMELGADDYVTKPFTTDELLKTIRTRLHKESERNRHYEEAITGLRQVIDHTIPHELRTPLTLILGYSDLMLADFESLTADQALTMIQTIHKAGMRLFRLIENYLLYTQLEIVGMQPDKVHLLRQQTLSNPQYVIETAATMKAYAVNRSEDLILDLENAPVNATENDLRKIAEELIDNALKFSDKGSPIQVNTFTNNGHYVLRVTDQGFGMSQEEMRRIGAYMQFERAVHEQQGMGLGLVIVRRLVDAYGGYMTLDSQPQYSTTVTIGLPMG
ncbi:MAG: response regulator [Anaerolineales bacterium]|nr:response regulator [Anaerolineales bacterium]